MTQTLKVSSNWLRRAKLALDRHFSTQKAFAAELGLSTRKVSDFFNGRPIDSENFQRICQKLDLEWQKVARIAPKDLESMSSAPLASETKPIAAARVAPPTTQPAPVEEPSLTQSTSIPRLASHLFKNFNAPGSVDALPRKKFVPVNAIEEPEIDDDEESDDVVEPFTPTGSVASVRPEPAKPVASAKSGEPIEPVASAKSEPVKPIASAKVVEPVQPTKPVEPVKPAPSEPIAPVQVVEPVQPTKSADPVQSVKTVASKPPAAQPSKTEPQAKDAIATSPQKDSPQKAQDAASLTLEALQAVLAELNESEPNIIPTPLVGESPEEEIESRERPTKTTDRPTVEGMWEEEDGTELPLEHDDVAELPLEHLEALAEDDLLKQPAPEVAAIALRVIPEREQSERQDLKPLLKQYRDACAIEDWDAASEVIRYTDWHYLKEIGELPLILELHRQLLPNNWRNGGSKVSDPYRHWQILHNCGGASYYLGDLDAAVEFYEMALKLVPQLDRPDLELSVLYGLGLTYQAMWQYQTAIKYFQQFLMRSGEQQDWQAQTAALCSLGNIYYALRQYRTAISYYQKFLSTPPESDRQAREISILGNLGSAYYKLGDYQAAIDCQQRYLGITRVVGNYEKETNALIALGFAYSAQGLEQTAIEYHQQALNLARQLRNEHLQMSALKGLGHGYRELDNHRMAISCYQQWLEIAKKSGDRDEQVQAMYSLRKLHSTLVKAN
ncbi:tetratricopeptide repeat protein [Pseudanabaena sp. PCC 6802]|uniref:tetratricopeptide repeat protein n=1 Tax=Pseudanabaena sp. PCC 6802 TaxID=118173 RepID=UPI0003450754|nr:tetratricopeptide repeat protein [Pseudanabaena sp. PCC 6802]